MLAAFYSRGAGTPWLLQKIRDDLASASASHIARGLTHAGFLESSPEADALWAADLATAPVEGWLASVYQSAKASFDRQRWAYYWFAAFSGASDGEGAFAAWELVAACSDERWAFDNRRPTWADQMSWPYGVRSHYRLSWKDVQKRIKDEKEELKKTYLWTDLPLQNQWPRRLQGAATTPSVQGRR